MRISVFLLLIVIAVWLVILERTGLVIRAPFDPVLGIVGFLAGVALGVVLVHYSIERLKDPQLQSMSVIITILALLAAGSAVLLGFSIIDTLNGKTQILGLIVWTALTISSTLLIRNLVHRYRVSRG